VPFLPPEAALHPSLVFRPMYAKVGRAMIDASVINVMTLTD
jgi:hypothetical protein